MSATTVQNKKKSDPAPAPTTGRGAAVCIALGLALLTLGCGFALALLLGGDGYALALLRSLAEGLAGPLCPALTILLLWGGAKLLVSTVHQVSARNFFIGAGIFWLILTIFTLSAYSRQGAPYLDALRLQADWSAPGLKQYDSFLRLAYRQGAQGAGGWLGMLLAYPLWQTVTRVGGILLCAVALAALALTLLRLTPADLARKISGFFRKVQDKMTDMLPPEQPANAADAQPDEPGFQPAPGGHRQQEAAPVIPPDYYHAAPIYDPRPVYAPAPDPQPAPPASPLEEEDLYPVQAGLYPDRYSRQPENGPEPDPAPSAWDGADELDMPLPEPPPDRPAQPVRAPRTKRQPTNPVNPPAEEAAPSPQPKPKRRHPFQAPAEEEAPQAQGPEAPFGLDAEAQIEPYERPANLRPAAPTVTHAQALDETDDDLPWEVPAAQPTPRPAAQTVPPPAAASGFGARETAEDASAARQPARQPRSARCEQRGGQRVPDAAPSRPGAKAPMPPALSPAAPASASWADQVRARQAEAQGDLPRHTTAKNDPQPVYIDPAVPITGERIPITPRREKTDVAARMDGTSAPAQIRESVATSVPYQAPPIRLLNEPRQIPQADARQEDERRAQIIEGTLRSFGVESEVKQIMHGPSITQFAIQIAPGVKVNRVANTADNLALELKTPHVRVESPIQGTNYIGIEVPNHLVNTVALREVLESPEMRNNPNPMLAALGKNIAGAPVLCDLSKMPHLLIAGATGSGKSVCINSIVCSLLYRTTPDQVRMIMIDPKQVELSVYNTIPHLLVPVICDPKKAAGALNWVVQEMLERYAKFSAAQVRNLAGYNKLKQGTEDALPNIVVIIDEMADLMEVCRKDVEESIRRLAALARAAGIYMVLATQRPSVDVITGVVKNNIPSRIAFAVTSGTDSRTIIDINGAEKLMGKGDMLYKPTGSAPMRVQGCFVSDEEVNAIAEYIGSRYQTDFDPNIVDHLENPGKDGPAPDDAGGDMAGASGNEAEFGDLLQQAIEMAVEDGQTSTSMLQRRLRVGYARAGRLIDEMEKRGIISQSEGSKPRKTLVTREQYAQLLEDDE